MARRKRSIKRETKIESKYGSAIVLRLINSIMKDGKKTIAENIVYQALEMLSKTTKKSPLESLDEVILNVKPVTEVKSRRVGGATYQVPSDVSDKRGVALVIRWLKDFAQKRNEKTMIMRLYNEMLDALNNRGASVKKKEETHKAAASNQAYSHFKI